MVDDGVKISALNEILTEPATGEMAAVVSGGVTYKRDIGKRLPSTTQKSALAGYGGTPSSTNPYATQAGATTIATNLATPLSNLNRVFHLTGDGIPTFPDNVAGTVYRGNNFTAIPSGWVANNSPTSTFSGGIWKITANGAYAGYYRTAASGLDVIKVRVLAGSVNIDFADGSAPIKSFTPSGSWQYAQTYSSTGAALRILAGADASTVYEIADIYIGSGLYDTPVYGADGQSVWENHSVLAVPGERGNGMEFLGNGYLESPNPLGMSGVLAFKYKKTVNNVYENITANYNPTDKSGLAVIFTDAQVLSIIYGDGSTENIVAAGTTAIAGSSHSFVVNYTATTIGPVFRDGIQVLAQISLPSTIKQSTSITRIGCPLWSTSAHLLNGILSDPRYEIGTWDIYDALRYHNGDDAVDSQQKAITNVPNAIKICDSKGNIRQPGLPVYTDNTAALAGGLVAGEPYRTSTGVLMVVF